jgi:hypothetical protein
MSEVRTQIPKHADSAYMKVKKDIPVTGLGGL